MLTTFIIYNSKSRYYDLHKKILRHLISLKRTLANCFHGNIIRGSQTKLLPASYLESKLKRNISSNKRIRALIPKPKSNSKG